MSSTGDVLEVAHIGRVEVRIYARARGRQNALCKNLKSVMQGSSIVQACLHLGGCKCV